MKDELLHGIRNGDIRALSKAISLVESSRVEHQERADELIDELMPYTGNSIRLGITGTPGAGKSTFIDSIGNYLAENGKKVAVLAIDPSSTVTGGSILGDKTRMEKLSKQKDAYIRPTPSKGYSGGVAMSTYKSILLLEAFGFDTILIETVGVGQSETMVIDLVDMVLMITHSGGGDGLQGMKRGIMEHVDFFFINKVDEDPKVEDYQLLSDLRKANSILSGFNNSENAKIVMGSAIKEKNIDEVWKNVQDSISDLHSNNGLQEKRNYQNKKQLQTVLQNAAWQEFLSNLQNSEKYSELLQKLENGENLSLVEIRKLVQNMG